MQGPLQPRASILDLEAVLLHTCYWATVWTVVCYGRCASVSSSVTINRGTSQSSRFHVYVATRHAHRPPGTQVLIGRFCELGSRLGLITPMMEELCEFTHQPCAVVRLVSHKRVNSNSIGDDMSCVPRLRGSVQPLRHVMGGQPRDEIRDRLA